MILREPEVPFYGLLFLLNKYATLGITARSKSTAKYPDLSSAIWHVSQTKFHTVKVCQYQVYWIRQMYVVHENASDTECNVEAQHDFPTENQCIKY